MGCSSSTLTKPQEGNKPPAQTVETNGPKMGDHESSTNGIPPKEKQAGGAETAPTIEDSSKFKEDDEANKQEVSGEPDTKGGEAGHPADVAKSEMYVMTNVEE